MGARRQPAGPVRRRLLALRLLQPVPDHAGRAFLVGPRLLRPGARSRRWERAAGRLDDVRRVADRRRSLRGRRQRSRRRDRDGSRRPAGRAGRRSGSQALAFGWHTRLCAETGRELVAADDLGPRLRWTKSGAEQARLRAAGAIGSAAVDAILAAAAPGATEAEAVAEGVRVIVAGGGAVYGMGVSSGPSAHTYGPSSPAPYDGRRRLVPGDMFRIDLYGSVDGYCFDFGRSRVVGARATPTQQAVLVAARDSVLAGVSAVRVGATLGDVARACDEAIAASEWARGGDRLPPGLAAWGHAVGVGLEPPWIVATSTDRIEPGMCLAIERRIVDPGVGGSTYEENLLVTESGIELLSTSRSWIDDERRARGADRVAWDASWFIGCAPRNPQTGRRTRSSVTGSRRRVLFGSSARSSPAGPDTPSAMSVRHDTTEQRPPGDLRAVQKWLNQAAQTSSLDRPVVVPPVRSVEFRQLGEKAAVRADPGAVCAQPRHVRRAPESGSRLRIQPGTSGSAPSAPRG